MSNNDEVLKAIESLWEKVDSRINSSDIRTSTRISYIEKQLELLSDKLDKIRYDFLAKEQTDKKNNFFEAKYYELERRIFILEQKLDLQ